MKLFFILLSIFFYEFNFAISAEQRISAKKCNYYKTPVSDHFCFGYKGVQCKFLPKCPNVQGLIIKGIKTKTAEFPHMAAIGWNRDDGNVEFRCGGSLISENFVLTAAHCTTGDSNPDFVRLGDTNLNPKVDDKSEPVDVSIDKIIIHENYEQRTSYDIALLKLGKWINVMESIYVRPACLQQQEITEEKSVTVTGWGKTKLKTGSESDHLRKAYLTMQTPYQCRTKLRQLKIQGSDIVCAVGKSLKGKVVPDTCQGDSGGPMQILDSDIECVYHVVGVISSGFSCGTTTPGFYVKVSSHLDWIEKHVWPGES